MEAIVQVQFVGHLLKGTTMTTLAVFTIEGEILMDHLVTHDVSELAFCKVVIVGHGNDGIVDVTIEPTSSVIMEIAAGT